MPLSRPNLPWESCAGSGFWIFCSIAISIVPAERLDPEVLIALRLGLYQLRFLERVPAHAAVSESVELVKRARKYSAARLVNAVLRRAAPEAKVSGKRTGVASGIRFVRRSRWDSALAPDLARRAVDGTIRNRSLLALLEANNRPRTVCCCVLDPGSVETVGESLRETGFQTAGPLAAVRPDSLGRESRGSRGVSAGRISLQDEASQMIAHLVDARPGESVLDLCSAPGGKTLLLARAVGPNGNVVAADLHEPRLRAVREQIARTGTRDVSLLAFDATRPLPLGSSFSRILVDAPCSGTGTLSRNPEIRWRLEPQDLPTRMPAKPPCCASDGPARAGRKAGVRNLRSRT